MEQRAGLNSLCGRMRMKKRKETSKNLINAGRGIVNKPKKQAESGLGDIKGGRAEQVRPSLKKIMKNIDPEQGLRRHEGGRRPRSEIKRWAPGGWQATRSPGNPGARASRASRGQSTLNTAAATNTLGARYIKSKWLLELLTNTYTPISTTSTGNPGARPTAA